MKPALQFSAVRKAYGKRHALNGLNLTVEAGSVFGLVGSNGAGKTTAMAVAVGLLQADAGTIDLLGEGAFRPDCHHGRVALLPQDSRLPLHAGVEELLHFYGRLQGLARSETVSAVNEMLAWTHLEERRRSAVRTLSHGMMRRLTIAQAFLGRPELVLLDEPLSGLDPREVVRIRELIRQRRGRQTIILSSHNLHELEAVCDAVAFIELGRLLRQDTLAAMMKSHHRITYVLQPGPVPMNELRTLRPDVTWELCAKGVELRAEFSGATAVIPEINAQTLAVLLRAGIGILEIRCGSDLESEYLAATESCHSPGPEAGRSAPALE